MPIGRRGLAERHGVGSQTAEQVVKAPVAGLPHRGRLGRTRGGRRSGAPRRGGGGDAIDGHARRGNQLELVHAAPDLDRRDGTNPRLTLARGIAHARGAAHVGQGLVVAGGEPVDRLTQFRLGAEGSGLAE